MAWHVVEGTWEEISRYADQFAGHRVRLIVLNPDAEHASSDSQSGAPGVMVSRGMFPQLLGLTDADLRTAEFRGDADDGLDLLAEIISGIA